MITLKLKASTLLEWLKKVKLLSLKSYMTKIKPSFTIHADYESISVPQNNEKQNPDESCTNKN